MKKFERKLFYNYIVPPRKIELRSAVMNLNHSIDQSDWDKTDENKQIIGMDDLFKLAETGLFEKILVLAEPDMFLYYYVEGSGEIKKIYKGWLDIMRFSGGKQSDPLKFNSKVIKYKNSGG